MGKQKFNLQGKIFGKWIVIKESNNQGITNKSLWLCRCQCGNEKIVVGSDLVHGGSTKCKQCAIVRPIHNFIGETFNKLKVIAFSHKDKHGYPHWICQCSCDINNKKICSSSSLKRGHSKNCGKCEPVASSRHRMSKHPLYHQWHGLNSRCNDKDKKDFPRYGARNIFVCDEWKMSQFGGDRNGGGFLLFWKWSEEQASKQGISLEDLYYKKNGKGKYWTLDRIDNDGPYAPWNCRWATAKEQNNNKRKARK